MLVRFKHRIYSSADNYKSYDSVNKAKQEMRKQFQAGATVRTVDSVKLVAGHFN